MRTLTVLVLGCVVALSAGGKVRQRNWQTGKVLDATQTVRYLGSVAQGSTSSVVTGPGLETGSVSMHSIGVYGRWETVGIEVGDRVYFASRRVHRLWSKPSDLTVNNSIRVAIEGTKLYYLDEQGKEHKATIVKKIKLEKQAQ